MVLKKILFTIFLLCVASMSYAQDCILIPSISLCGVPITATRTQFVKVLGNPDGLINMGPDRVGLLYGQRLILIFWHEKLWQTHAWETHSNIDFWSYVRNQEVRNSLRLKFKNWSPWGLSRKEIAQNAKTLPVVDEDEYSEIRRADKDTLSVYYKPTAINMDDPNIYQVDHIKVTFGVTPHEP